MGRMIIDAVTSLDGFCADARGESVFSVENMHQPGMIASLVDMCGAVVMSRHTFDMVEDPDWFADNYELQVPIFVVTAAPPRRSPKENDRLTFHFVASFPQAMELAQKAAGDKAVVAIGGPRMVQAALLSGLADEMWLRIVDRPTGGGTPLFGPGLPGKDFFVSALETTQDSVQMKLQRR
ncbi:MAG TPA: riboflavin biosynthesis protein RibD [Novosphingobium sp.]|nr:riboflavin biosynthesis protein RibD [Novosphingobium sp.]